MNLNNKIAIVTGGASGIGRATSMRFAESGATVLVADKSTENAHAVVNQIISAGYSAGVVGLDVTDPDDVKSRIDEIRGRYGRIDILVNNAGYGFAGTVTDTSLADWRSVFDVNVTGVFLMSREVLPVMVEQGGGNIVNTASTGALVGIRDRAAYCATKGAVAALTRSMALDHAAANIRVNAVCPGTVDTPYHAEIAANAGEADQFYAALEARQPLGRLGEAVEIASAITYLASDEASFCTGSLFVVDGGMTAQ